MQGEEQEKKEERRGRRKMGCRVIGGEGSICKEGADGRRQYKAVHVESTFIGGKRSSQWTGMKLMVMKQDFTRKPTSALKLETKKRKVTIIIKNALDEEKPWK